MPGVVQKGSEFKEPDRMVGIVPFRSTEMLSSLGDKTALLQGLVMNQVGYSNSN